MASFQKIVLISAIIILIVALVFIGISLHYSRNKVWPPTVASCPDWWIMDGSGNNTNCINIKDLGTCKPDGNLSHQEMNFNTSLFSGSKGMCNKYTWAKNCNLTWDGITYGANNPCAK
jgi:hypothetical protein